MQVVPTCKECDQAIEPEDINVARDVAYCRRCNLVSSLAEMLGSSDGVESTGSEVDLTRPPAGCGIVYDGMGATIRATHRNLFAASGLLFFSLFWNGILSIFILVASAATIANLGWTVPAWFPAPEMDGDPMGVGMTLFLWVFLTPFIAVGLGTAAAVLLMIVGHTEIRVDQQEAVVHTGVGSLGYRRRFEPREVQRIEVGYTSTQVNGSPLQAVVVRCRNGRQVKFGSLMSDERRAFLITALEQAIRRFAPAAGRSRVTAITR